MSLIKCFIKMIDLSTIEIRKQFNFRKKQRYSFDIDNSRKIVKSFKSCYWNEKLNSTNKKQKKKIKDDRNRITITETEFKKRTCFKNMQIRKSKSKQQSEIQKIKIVRECNVTMIMDTWRQVTSINVFWHCRVFTLRILFRELYGLMLLRSAVLYNSLLSAFRALM